MALNETYERTDLDDHIARDDAGSLSRYARALGHSNPRSSIIPSINDF